MRLMYIRYGWLERLPLVERNTRLITSLVFAILKHVTNILSSLEHFVNFTLGPSSDVQKLHTHP